MEKNSLSKDNDNEILESLCKKMDIEITLIKELIQVEKDYQFHERRRGINDRLKEKILPYVKTTRRANNV